MNPSNLRSRFFVLSVALVATWILGGCGGSGAVVAGNAKPIVGGDVPLVTPVAVPDGVARLVPADAPITVYIQDPEKLLAAVRDLVKQIRPGTEAMLSADTLLSQTPFDLRARELDLNQPLAVVIGPEGPMHAVVAAADDPTDLADSKDSTAGKHAALAMPGRSAPKAGDASKALQALPSAGATGVTVRVDLSQFKAQIEQAEQMFRDAAASEPGAELVLDVYQPVFDFAKRGGVIDLMIAVEDGEVQLSTVVDVGIAIAKPEPGQPTVYDLLPRVPVQGDRAIVFAFGPVMNQFSSMFDLEKLMTGAFAPGASGGELPADFAAAMKDYVAAIGESYEAMDGPGAGTFSLGDGGMKGTWAMNVSDQARTAAAVHKMAKAMDRMGFASDVQHEVVEVGDAKFDYVDAAWDYDAFMKLAGAELPPGAPNVAEMMNAVYGERLRFAFGQHGDTAIMAMGMPSSGLSAVAETVRVGGQDHGAVAQMLAEVPGEQLVLFAHLDVLGMMRPIMRAMSDRMGTMPPIPEGSATMSLSVGCTGTRYRFNVAFDVGALARLR